MNRRVYPDDLTDEEWEKIKEFTEIKHTKRGRKPKWTKREMMNAIFYIMRGGCSWRHMPHDFPPWQSVYTQYRAWKVQGVFEKIHHFIRESLRQILGRGKEATGAIIDSQSIKTTEKGALQVMMEQKILREEKGMR